MINGHEANKVAAADDDDTNLTLNLGHSASHGRFAVQCREKSFHTTDRFSEIVKLAGKLRRNWRRFWAFGGRPDVSEKLVLMRQSTDRFPINLFFRPASIQSSDKHRLVINCCRHRLC